jgi:DNA-binding CsgD family transcriptional regulator
MVRRWPLTARSEQLEQLGAWYSEGQIGGAVLSGPAGVGKTRLAEEVLALATAADRPVARAVGHPTTRPIPLGALAHLLPAPQIHEFGLELTDRAGLFHAASSALRGAASSHRLVVMVDDIDELDETSLALLLPLTVERVIFLLATIRSGHELPSTFAAMLKDSHLERMEVTPLDDHAVANLLHRVLDAPIDTDALRRLHQASGGNLQVLHELVRTSRDAGSLVQQGGVWILGALPRSAALEDLVASHLAGVAAEARAALDVLAVAGKLGLCDLEELCSADVVSDLEQDGLITVTVDDRRTDVAMAHPMYGEVLRARLATLRLRSIQRRLAEQIARRGARRRDDTMRLAIWRLETGGDLDRQLLYDAGRLALVGRDTVLAERFAAAAVNRGWAVIGARVMIESALLRSCPDDVEAAVASVWHRTDLTDGDVAHCAYRLAELRFGARRDLDGALAVLDDALTRITFRPSRALLEAHRAKMLANAGRPLAAMDAIDRVTEVDDVRVRVDVATARSAALLTLGRSDEAIVAARSGAAAQADLPPWLARRGMAGHLVNEAHALAYSGRYRAAKALIEPAASRAQRAGALAGWVWFELVLGEIARDTGRGSEAVRHFTTAVELADRAGQGAAAVWAHVGVAQGMLLMGDANGAGEALALADAVGESPVGTSDTTRERCRAWLMACTGDLTAARKHIAAIADTVAADGIYVFEVALRHDLARFGDAASVVERLEELTAMVDGPLVLAMATHARAAADHDAEQLADALRQFEAIDSLVFAAEVASDLAEVYRRNGDQRAATAATQQMAQLIERVGGARTPPLLRGAGVEPLTAREREVALLAANGLTSKDIAARLYLSKRTVDTHLDRIYRKLGVSGRDELDAALENAVGGQ